MDHDIPVNKRAECADCGKIVWKSKTSALVQVCRECRASRAMQHGTKASYNKGCRCGTCREGAASRMRAHMARVRRDTSGRYDCSIPECTRVRKGHGLCGMHLRRTQRAEGTYRPSPSDAWTTPARVARAKRRKAVLRGAPTGGGLFTVADLIERDGDTCGLCGHAIGDIAWPDPLSRSIDHITPISLGGGHTIENARATHLRCNISRGNRPDAEQRHSNIYAKGQGGDPLAAAR